MKQCVQSDWGLLLTKDSNTSQHSCVLALGVEPRGGMGSGEESIFLF